MYLDDIISLLTQAGLGNYGVGIFKGPKALYPAGPGPFITVISSGGGGDEGTHNLSRDQIAYERPDAQIVARAEDYDVADAAIQVAFQSLNFYDRFVNGTWWRVCSPKSEPFDLPVDGQGRVRRAFNLATVKRVSPLTS